MCCAILSPHTFPFAGFFSHFSAFDSPHCQLITSLSNQDTPWPLPQHFPPPQFVPVSASLREWHPPFYQTNPSTDSTCTESPRVPRATLGWGLQHGTATPWLPGALLGMTPVGGLPSAHRLADPQLFHPPTHPAAPSPFPLPGHLSPGSAVGSSLSPRSGTGSHSGVEFHSLW